MTKITDIPAIRFKGFSDTWEQRKFDEVFDCTVPNNTLSRAELSYDEGTVLNVHYGDVLIKYGSVLDVQKDDIPRIPYRCREDFNGALLQDGDVIIADTAEDETTGKACEIGNLQGRAIVSGLHTMVCRPRHRMALGYLGHYLNSNAYHHQLLPLMQGIKVLSLSRSNIQKTSVSYPTVEKEQQLIANYFSQLDNLITLHQRKYDKLTNVKKSMLEKMFPQNGSNVPEIRFKGFTEAWEQRKVSELFKVTRGYVLAATLTEPAKTDEMPYPVYSSQTKDNGLMGYYKDYLYEDAITWTTDGANAGTVNYRAGKFYCTNVCGVLLSNEVTANQMIAEALNNVAKGYVSYVGNPKLMNNVMADIEIMIPTHAEEREKLSVFFRNLDNLITLHQRKCQIDGCRFQSPLAITWEQRKLGEIGSVSMCRRIFKEQTSENGEIPFYKIGTFGGEADAFISRELFEEYKAKYQYPKKGDILISASGSIGRTVVFTGKNEYFQDSNIVWLNHDKHLDNSFLKCFYSIVKWAGIEGSTIKRLYNDNILNTAITLPSVEEQQKIGAYFENLDNLITLHQRKPVVVNSSSTMNALPNQHLYFQVLE